MTEGAATTEDQTCFLPQDVKHGKVALYEDDGLCYMFFKDDGVTWSEINATCAAHGGFPVSIKVCLLSSYESNSATAKLHVCMCTCYTLQDENMLTFN